MQMFCPKKNLGEIGKRRKSLQINANTKIILILKVVNKYFTNVCRLLCRCFVQKKNIVVNLINVESLYQ